MRRKLLVAASALLLIAFGGCVYVSSVPLVSADEFRAAVERDLPVGTPKAEVAAWLTAHGYRFGDIATTARDGKTTRLCGYFAEFPNYLPGRLGLDLGQTTLQCFIYFDEQDRRTTDFTVREVSISL